MNCPVCGHRGWHSPEAHARNERENGHDAVMDVVHRHEEEAEAKRHAILRAHQESAQ